MPVPLVSALIVGVGGTLQISVTFAVPVIDAVTVSVAVIDCDPLPVSVALNVFTPASPRVKV